MTTPLFDPDAAAACRPAGMDASEWQARLELAACYRVFFARGWAEEIFNHITVRVVGPEGAPAYLINPFGLHYGEVTAHNLVKVDLAGRPLHDTAYGINRAGFVIHSAIHAARPDAHCVIHTHDRHGVAVACKAEGLAPDNFYAAFLDGRVAYHDFEGVTTSTAEQPRLVASLGTKPVMILRNHGLLVAEHSVASAFYWYYVLQSACHVQALAHAMPGETLRLSDAARAQSSRNVQDSDPQGDLYPKVFGAAVRRAGVTLAQLCA
ncbi:MAG: class II aldolase/adducin family protein [Rhodoferax sp.]|nr:class II aldolase/adducin family protein [Rhodoferax sp.]